MGMRVSIDINFAQEYSPKDILTYLLNNNWTFNYQDSVHYLLAKDTDDYDWQAIAINEFNIDEFIRSHDATDRIGITMVVDNQSGGDFLIYPNYVSILLSINNKHLINQENIPDFSWYLSKLKGFLDTIKLSSLQCEVI